MKNTFIFLFLVLPALCFSQGKNYGEKPEPVLKKFEIQIAAGIPIDVKPVNVFIGEANFYYQFGEGFYAGAGFLYAKDFEDNYYSPNVSAFAQFNKDKISPYLKIATGPNFTKSGNSGLYFSLGGGAKYDLTDRLDMTTEFTMKSFSYQSKSIVPGDPDLRINYTYFIPYIGISLKL